MALVTRGRVSGEPPSSQIMLLSDMGNNAENAPPVLLEAALSYMGRSNNPRRRVPRSLPGGIYMFASTVSNSEICPDRFSLSGAGGICYQRWPYH